MSDREKNEEARAEVLSVVLFVGGAVALIVGVAMLSGPLAWIAGGALALFFGWRLAR